MLLLLLKQFLCSKGMRTPRAPSSPSPLLHLVCRQQPTTTFELLTASSCSPLRPQLAQQDRYAPYANEDSRLHVPWICFHRRPHTFRRFSSSTRQYENVQRPPIETERLLTFLTPKEIWSRRGQPGTGFSNWRRGLFGRKMKEEVPEKTTSSTYLGGTENSIVGRHLLHKPNDMVLRCTEFDQDGERPSHCLRKAWS